MKTVILMSLLVTGVAAYGEGQPKPVNPPGQTQTFSQNQDQSQTQTQSQDQSANNAVNVSGDRQVRQAPSIGLVIPPSTPRMKCLGFGGSNETGSAVTGWCWLARDAWAADRSARLADLGLYVEAAEAYCSQRVHRRDFPNGDCRERIAESLAKQNKSDQPQINVFIDVEKQTCEVQSDSEIVVKEYLDTHGYSVLYDCVERKGKGG